MKSITIHPVVPDPEISVTMSLKEAKALRDFTGELTRTDIRNTMPKVSNESIDAIDMANCKLYDALAARLEELGQ